MTQSDSSKKADILNCQFSSVFNKDEQCDSIPNKGPSPFNDMPDNVCDVAVVGSSTGLGG
jgi:hypothetical protein